MVGVVDFGNRMVGPEPVGDRGVEPIVAGASRDLCSSSPPQAEMMSEIPIPAVAIAMWATEG